MIEEGKTYYFYDSRADKDVCKAHVLKVLPHPEREDDRLIVYCWYGKHRRRWWYGVTTISQQEMWADYVHEVVSHEKEKRKRPKKCGECGFFMRYVRSDGQPDHDGDCASIGMNNECNEGNNHFKDPDESLLQVDESEVACGFFKAKRTKRVRDYIKRHPQLYVQHTNFKPLKSR